MAAHKSTSLHMGDHGEQRLSTLRHIAKEGSVYVVGSCIAMRKDDIPDHLAFKDLYDPVTLSVALHSSPMISTAQEGPESISP